ncbi:glycosyltransferase [Lysobacter sp. S4-A87]|uniref:glycosyltransferase n=1 Tax=Lysobacter sp. S4-A87 TaxID=2925843 RepID=UPI001F52D2E1|nr:glycosyltransferase [Lysobacter sp. S4-A87]UNK50267.1 glycosyltransferase [Lysobacter sp. S4-A87]
MNAQALSALQLRSSAGLYGAERMVLALDRGLVRAGVRSRLLSINNYRMDEQALHDTASAAGHDAVLLPCRGRMDTGTVSALAAQITAAGSRAVVHSHDYKSAFYAWLATRRQPARLVATLHGWVEGTSSLRLYTRLELALLRRFDALVAVSTDQVARLARAGVPRWRIHCIDNGIDFPAADAIGAAALRDELGIAPDTHVFAAVARLSPEKNLAMLLQAFAPVARRSPGAVLLVVGDGPERASLQSLAGELGLGAQLRLLGSRSDMGAIYALTDCLVLPSLTEGMPLVVLEAMACGVPVLASAVGDVPRLLAHADHGRLVPAGDREALQGALADTAALPRRVDLRARQYVRENHGAQAMAERYLGLYLRLQEKTHDRRAS